MKLEIVYQDEFLVGINKPSGLLVHKTEISTETINAMHLLRDQLNTWVYPVHRLDRATSGILLFALNSEVASKICEHFASHEIEKRYLAIVRGKIEEEKIIDYPLKDIRDQLKHKKKKSVRPPLDAITHIQPVGNSEINFSVGPYEKSRYSLIEVYPKTGRYRQIRRHLKHIFHPIIGDVRFGDGKHNTLFREQIENSRLLLHAFSLKLQHPVSGKELLLKAFPDQSFSRAAKFAQLAESLDKVANV
jgi:tRNA pseudouridine65 synthase